MLCVCLYLSSVFSFNKIGIFTHAAQGRGPSIQDEQVIKQQGSRSLNFQRDILVAIPSIVQLYA